MSKEPKDKTPQPVSTEQPREQPYESKGLRRVSPEEARRLGRPIRNDLIVSPTPSAGQPARPSSEKE
jgi:hypothetical protein